MGREGFEPSKALPADLQSVPFGHSGICPFFQGKHDFFYHCLLKADERTRTVNLLITNQLLCQLSHIGLFIFYNKHLLLFYSFKPLLFIISLPLGSGTYRARTCDPLLVRQVLSQLS